MITLKNGHIDGSPFDIKGFQKIVYQAAEKAEKKRPDGLTDVTQHILLLEPDPSWRKNSRIALVKTVTR